MEVNNKNKKRYVYLDKYEEYKKQIADRLALQDTVIYWLIFGVLLTFLLCLVDIFIL